MTTLIDNTGIVVLNQMHSTYEDLERDLRAMEDLVVQLKNDYSGLNEKQFAESKDLSSKSKRRQAGRRLSFLKTRLTVELGIEALLRSADLLSPYTSVIHRQIEGCEVKDPRQVQILKINALLAVKLIYRVRAFCKETSVFIERSACVNPELRETLDEEFHRIYRSDAEDDAFWLYFCK